MRHLVYYVAVSLDGKIATTTGDAAAFDADGDHLGTIFREWSDTIPGHLRAALGLPPADGARFDTVLMGWNTYAAGLPGVNSPYPHLRQFVVTTKRAVVARGVAVIDGDPLRRVRELKKQPGRDIWLCGGGTLAGALAPEIDRLVLKVNPIVLGDGIPLFAVDDQCGAFKLCTSTAYRSGVLINDYIRR